MRKILRSGLLTVVTCSLMVTTVVSLSTASAADQSATPSTTFADAAGRTVPVAPFAVHEDHADESEGADATAVAVDMTPSVSLHPSMVVRGASVDEQRRLDEALARYAEAGLELPDLEVVFADDPDVCSGHDGLFRTSTSPWQVLVCSDMEFVVTHELAHAWDAANLDDIDREWYTDRRGLTTWDSSDADWVDRGVEDLAFMIQQNLMAGAVDVDSERWVERANAYGWATGRTSPVLPTVQLTARIS